MTLIYGTFFLLFVFAGTGMHFSPRTLYEMGVIREEPPPCQKVDEFQLQSEGEAPKGKGATYDPEEYRCPRPLFEYGERDSFYDFVTLHAAARLRRLGSQLLKERSANTTWSITVVDDDPHLAAYVKSVAATELGAILGPGAIQKRRGRSDIGIRIRRVSDPALLFDITMNDRPQKVALQ